MLWYWGAPGCVTEAFGITLVGLWRLMVIAQPEHEHWRRQGHCRRGDHCEVWEGKFKMTKSMTNKKKIVILRRSCDWSIRYHLSRIVKANGCAVVIAQPEHEHWSCTGPLQAWRATKACYCWHDIIKIVLKQIGHVLCCSTNYVFNARYAFCGEALALKPCILRELISSDLTVFTFLTLRVLIYLIFRLGAACE